MNIETETKTRTKTGFTIPGLPFNKDADECGVNKQEASTQIAPYVVVIAHPSKPRFVVAAIYAVSQSSNGPRARSVEVMTQ